MLQQFKESAAYIRSKTNVQPNIGIIILTTKKPHIKIKKFDDI